MPRSPRSTADFGALLASVLLLAVSVLMPSRLIAQGVPTVQQSQFRSQWVGEQVDQIPLGGSITPLNGLGAIVGALQTPDEVDREVQASLAGVKAKSPFAFKPSLGVGWQISNQGALNTNSAGETSYSPDSSPFFAPAGAFLYDREHGPWAVSAGYSAGLKYFVNPNYTGNGVGSQRNPFSQTAFFKTVLEMSRYIFDTLLNASYGNGFDVASGANNNQLVAAAASEMKYLLSSSSALSLKGGYSVQNYSGATNTPNNTTANYYGTFAPIYELSDKTHLSAIFGAGASYQSLQPPETTIPITTDGVRTGSVNYTTTSSSSVQYAQSLGKVKYDVTGKLTVEAALGARVTRLLNSTNVSGSINQDSGSESQSYHTNSVKDLGVKPAWTLGFNYTPTAKTSVVFSAGQQGSDIVPELNFLVNWVPREKTSLSFGVSQTETYSSISASQYLISQNAFGTLTQKLFSSVDLQLSGGYTKQEYKNITGNATASQNRYTSQIPQSYYMGNLSLIWRIRDWAALVNTFSYNTGQQITGSSGNTQAQAWYSISLNFAL